MWNHIWAKEKLLITVSWRNLKIKINIPVINPKIANTFENVTTLQQQQQNFLWVTHIIF